MDLDQLQEEGIDLGEMMSYLEEGGEEEEESTRLVSLPFPKRITPHQRMKLNCRTFSSSSVAPPASWRPPRSSLAGHSSP